MGLTNGDINNANSCARMYAGVLLVFIWLSTLQIFAVDTVLPPPSPIGSKVLQQNWDALRERGLRLLPVPKQIEFKGEPVVIDRKSVV